MHSFIEKRFTEHLLVPATRAAAVNQIKKDPCPYGADILIDKEDIQVEYSRPDDDKFLKRKVKEGKGLGSPRGGGGLLLDEMDREGFMEEVSSKQRLKEGESEPCGYWRKEKSR